MSLNERQKAFCEYYAACFNATEAAKKAGYSPKTARSTGAENLTKPDIQKYLQQLMMGAKRDRIADIDEIMAYLTTTMRNGDEQTRERTKAAQLLGEILSRTEQPDDEPLEAIRVVFEDASNGAEDNNS